jgi:hypothetical protein
LGILVKIIVDDDQIYKKGYEMSADFKKMAEKFKEQGLSLEDMLARAYHAGYSEKVNGYGQFVVEKPQPAVLWALIFKDHGVRRVAFSFDGPPSAAYIKLGQVK